jgi:hypothetical protein
MGVKSPNEIEMRAWPILPTRPSGPFMVQAEGLTLKGKSVTSYESPVI